MHKNLEITEVQKLRVVHLKFAEMVMKKIWGCYSSIYKISWNLYWESQHETFFWQEEMNQAIFLLL